MTRTIPIGDASWTILCNPARMRSTGARLDAASIAARPCFLCSANRPSRQLTLPWRDYEILVNPFPIFNPHFTVVAKHHAPQTLDSRLDDMAALSRELGGDWTLFFNGARSGASAPDHAHFQIVATRYLPMMNLGGDTDHFGPVGFFRGTDSLACLDDALVNVLMTQRADGTTNAVVIPRRRHRPDCFFAPEPYRIMASPASIDLAGVMVLVREEDFHRLTPESLNEILTQTTYTPDELPR